MPNWVFNEVTITGDADLLAEFVEKSQAVHPEGVKGDTGEWKMTDKPEFSFWNFVRPPQEAVESGEYFGTHGWSGGVASGHTPNNWYEFNNREWGTKWDACDVYLEDNGSSVSVSFNTAWGIPVPVFEAMCRLYPDLDFGFYAQEEQGWGAEYESAKDEDEDGNTIGVLMETKSWDIPDSHADYVAIDDVDGCVCQHEEVEEWYDDCPRSEEEEQIVAHDAEGSVTAEKLRNKFNSEFGGLVEPK